jgi:uncharacterized membrane protein
VTGSEVIEKGGPPGPPKIYSIAAVVFAAAGLADSAYLTAKHFSGGEVPCSVIEGCEQVLTSAYAELFGIPTAAFGAAAYFAAFSLAILTYYGNSRLWNLFGLLTLTMAGFTVWLVYLQAYVIGAFCQFCLISAATTTLLLVTFVASRLFTKN